MSKDASVTDRSDTDTDASDESDENGSEQDLDDDLDGLTRGFAPQAGSEILILPPPHIIRQQGGAGLMLPEVRRPALVVDLPSAERLRAIAQQSSNVYEKKRMQATISRYLMAKRREASGICAVPESPCNSCFSSFNSALGSPKS